MSLPPPSPARLPKHSEEGGGRSWLPATKRSVGWGAGRALPPVQGLSLSPPLRTGAAENNPPAILLLGSSREWGEGDGRWAQPVGEGKPGFRAPSPFFSPPPSNAVKKRSRSRHREQLPPKLSPQQHARLLRPLRTKAPPPRPPPGRPRSPSRPPSAAAPAGRPVWGRERKQTGFYSYLSSSVPCASPSPLGTKPPRARAPPPPPLPPPPTLQCLLLLLLRVAAFLYYYCLLPLRSPPATLFTKGTYAGRRPALAAALRHLGRARAA